MRVRRSAVGAILGTVALCFFVTPAFSQIVTIEYTGPYSAVWESDGAGILGGDLNGSPVASGFICDDFQDQIHKGQTWSATVLNAAQLNSSNIDNVMFGSSIGLDGYAAVATLVSDMFNKLSPYGASQADISSAIWYITSNDLATNGSAGPGWAQLSTAAKSLVDSMITAFYHVSAATAENALDKFTNLWIYTPIPDKPGCAAGQEFWAQDTPEGGAALLYLLLAGACCFGTMLFSSRLGKRTTA